MSKGSTTTKTSNQTAQNESGTTAQNTSGTSANSSNSTTGPWGAISPIITGSLLPTLQSNYSQYGTLDPNTLATLGSGTSLLGGQSGDGSAISNAGYSLLGTQAPQAQQVTGQYIANSSVPSVGTSSVTAQSVDPTSSFSALGSDNPTAALSSALSGSVSNPYLTGVTQGNIASAAQQYGDLTSDAANTLNYDTLPGIRSGAALAGQYGGSRQGAEEGVATGLVGQQLARNARDLTASTTATNSGLLGTAYDQAADRQATAGQDLAGLGVANSTANADRDLSAQTTNAGNTLAASTANAANELNRQEFNVNTDTNDNQFNAGVTEQNNQQNLNQALAGAGLLGTGSGVTNSNILAQLGLLTEPANYANSTLGNYSSLLGGLAGLGSTNTGTNTGTTTGVSNGTTTGTATGTSSGTSDTSQSSFNLAQLLGGLNISSLGAISYGKGG